MILLGCSTRAFPHPKFLLWLRYKNKPAATVELSCRKDCFRSCPEQSGQLQPSAERGRRRPDRCPDWRAKLLKSPEIHRDCSPQHRAPAESVSLSNTCNILVTGNQWEQSQQQTCRVWRSENQNLHYHSLPMAATDSLWSLTTPPFPHKNRALRHEPNKDQSYSLTNELPHSKHDSKWLDLCGQIQFQGAMSGEMLIAGTLLCW